jgi:hypothetical protein
LILVGLLDSGVTDTAVRRVSGVRRRVVFGIAAALLLLGGLSLYLGVAIGRELSAARAIFTQPIGELRREDIAEAKGHLIEANRHLDGVAAAILRFVPLARQNIGAIDGAVDAGIPALSDAESLADALEYVEARDLVVDGRVQLSVIEQLEDPLIEQAQSLSVLDAALRENESGWLLPPIWDAVAEMGSRADELHASTRRTARLVDIIAPMLGGEGSRRYLVILVNNSELRGAGGILSGLGTLQADDGSLELGNFNYFGDLADENPRRVPAPADFEARFARYLANSTEWVNVTASPDVPDVALVASRLYELKTGIETDGVILIDPRGIAALMPSEARLTAPTGREGISKDDLPRFIYSEAYELAQDQDRRRKAILQLGSAAFKRSIEGGLSDRESLEDAGAAVQGQHIRVVSFDRAEQDVLEDAGVTGELAPSTNDNVLVTVQNLGGDKLDYWMDRSVAHTCAVLSQDVARCETKVELTNNAPEGLPLYVVQQKRVYGLYRGFVEVYVPGPAKLTGVQLNDGPAEFYKEHEEARTAVGMYFRTRRNETSTVVVSYDLPLEEPYALTVTPQPLTEDASLSVQITERNGWLIEGPGQTQAEAAQISFSGPLDATHEWRSVRDNKRGLSAIWRNLEKFLTEPLL